MNFTPQRGNLGPIPEACFGLAGGMGLSVECVGLGLVCGGLVKCLGACPGIVYCCWFCPASSPTSAGGRELASFRLMMNWPACTPYCSPALLARRLECHQLESISTVAGEINREGVQGAGFRAHISGEYVETSRRFAGFCAGVCVNFDCILGFLLTVDRGIELLGEVGLRLRTREQSDRAKIAGRLSCGEN